MDHRAELLAVEKIWEAAPHSAFTDLIRFRGAWLCAFREGEKHALCVGTIRVLASEDGASWRSAAEIAEEGVDLRDPHFSERPDGALELVMGGTYFRDGAYVGRRPRLSISADGRSWSRPEPILADGDWLWRATRRADGQAFGISYRLPRRNFWTVHLMESADGRSWSERTRLPVLGKPNEATIRFREDGSAVILQRRESGAARAWIGRAEAPYLDWRWEETKRYVGGPNFLIAPDGRMWAAGRFVGRGKARTALASMTENSIEPILDLPSGGDCSYPGMVLDGGELTMSYYSSHEGKSAVYLARIRIAAGS